MKRIINVYIRFLIGLWLPFIIFSSSSLQAQVCNFSQLPANLQNGLVAWYPFCGNANDASGNGLSATANNGTFVADRFGLASSALSFNGVNQKLELPINNYYNRDSFTIVFWTKPNADINPHNQIQLGTIASSLRWSVAWAPGYIRYSPMLCTGGYAAASLTTTTGLPLSSWSHVAVVVEGTTAKFYKNGIYLGQQTGASTLTCFNLGMNLYIGGDIGGGGIEYYNGLFDDLFFFRRAISSCEVSQLYSATSNAIPSATLNYDVFPDTTRQCGTSKVLDAGSGYSSYLWNTGATTQTITATTGGFYKVTVSNAAGCTGSDSTLLSLVNANILNNDTTICKGSSITLFIDSLFPGRTACNASQLPANLTNGLVGYWPFCGNANDATSYANNGTLQGLPTLVSDRFNRLNSAYLFNNIADYISISTFNLISGDQQRTFSFWFKIPPTSDGGFALSYGAELFGGGSCGNGFHFDINQTTSADCGFSGVGLGVNCVQRRRPIVLNNGIWHLMSLTYSGSGGLAGLKTYIDGQLLNSSICDQSSANSFNTQPQSFGLTVGRRQDALNYPNNSLVHFKGTLDDLSIYNRELTLIEIQSLYTSAPTVTWSTGATTNCITVSPTQTTRYYVTVSDGITTCMDSVLVTVSDIGNFNPLTDTTRQCGTSKVLDAGAGYNSYLWNTGATTRTITATTGGFYKVTVTNAAGCTASDSTLLSLVNANIIQNDTTICKGSSITLCIDSLFPGRTACNASQLPANLRNGLVGYWPFCGNANDMSGNGNNGTVNGATLVSDRFGLLSGAYNFNLNQTIVGNCSSFPGGNLPRSVSFWYNAVNVSAGTSQILGYGGGSCGQSFNMNFNNYDVPVGSYEVQGHCIAFRNFTTTPLPFNNTWHNITLIYDGSIFRFYNDGVLVKTSASTVLNTGTAGKIFCFGKEASIDGLSPYTDPGWPGFSGKLDDIIFGIEH